MKILPTALIWGTCVTCLACSSIHSTHVVRTGNEGIWETKHLHGMPITLNVPHHYEVRIVEIFHEVNGNILREASSRHPVTGIDVEFEVVHVQEVFTVDFVRPGAGTLKTMANLNGDSQYFTSIDNKIVDNTIDEITKSVKALSEAVAPLRSKKLLAEIPGEKLHRKILATFVVDVKDSTAKEQIHDFLCKHLNSCTNCDTRPGMRLTTTPAK